MFARPSRRPHRPRQPSSPSAGRLLPPGGTVLRPVRSHPGLHPPERGRASSGVSGGDPHSGDFLSLHIQPRVVGGDQPGPPWNTSKPVPARQRAGRGEAPMGTGVCA